MNLANFYDFCLECSVVDPSKKGLAIDKKILKEFKTSNLYTTRKLLQLDDSLFHISYSGEHLIHYGVYNKDSRVVKEIIDTYLKKGLDIQVKDKRELNIADLSFLNDNFNNMAMSISHDVEFHFFENFFTKNKSNSAQLFFKNTPKLKTLVKKYDNYLMAALIFQREKIFQKLLTGQYAQNKEWKKQTYNLILEMAEEENWEEFTHLLLNNYDKLEICHLDRLGEFLDLIEDKKAGEKILLIFLKTLEELIDKSKEKLLLYTNRLVENNFYSQYVYDTQVDLTHILWKNCNSVYLNKALRNDLSSSKIKNNTVKI